jgi:excisionase family DNA binding protein
MQQNQNKVSIIKKRISPEHSLTVSTSEAADLLGVCARTVTNLTRRGELPVVKIAGCVRYSREALAEFVQLKTVRESGERVA